MKEQTAIANSAKVIVPATSGYQLATGSAYLQLAPTCYEVTTRWEYRMHGEVRRTIIARHFTVSSESFGSDRRVTLLATPPALRPPDLTPLDELTVQLAGLYQRLVLRVAPTGQLVALLNHDEILHTWAALEPEIAARFGGDEPDELTAMLLAAVTQQVQRPEDVLASLQYDYAYGFLLQNPQLKAGAGGQQQVFPHFFADTTISFRVQLTPLPDQVTGQVGYRLHGILDEPGADRAAVARQVAAELAPDADPTPPPPAPDSLTFVYQASYIVDAHTGWPLTIEATASCQGPAGYAKEYDLTIAQL
jgi:hypothetical protein